MVASTPALTSSPARVQDFSYNCGSWVKQNLFQISQTCIHVFLEQKFRLRNENTSYKIMKPNYLEKLSYLTTVFKRVIFFNVLHKT